mmetsp:Transcript_5765/g.12119  ORF Transcript_5765/g.12119 Transcript_5765/m.12119 type:complete len:203 (+) Transcript_5765:185-793(+)|eukprot:CAMPEP_0174734684 /NCGR_PEP_ID=MMETSP1094-20130205/63744_1 /TAXON_ID=156173 /ORGANISM="Chrysochromulina brevifilum, Strain UTEX LB 985" /LENGTH=202 /DNA_ID=CAMNT_0015937535 /DNA_START=172 /DNA_END=780 /DNA_ORIENTATION=+
MPHPPLASNSGKPRGELSGSPRPTLAAHTTSHMDCGCVDECCGICEHARAAKRPRLVDADIATAWVPPDLNKLRGAKHRDARESPDSHPVMWYWQVTGKEWDLEGRSFDVAKKTYSRLPPVPVPHIEATTPVRDATCTPAVRSTPAPKLSRTWPWSVMNLPDLVFDPESGAINNASASMNWALRLEAHGLRSPGTTPHMQKT